MTVEEYRKSEKIPVMVVLDNIRSQNNIGSVFRTVDAFRLEGILLCGISSTPPHREIHKTALGATETVQWKYWKNTPDAVADLIKKGYQILSVEQVENGESLDRLQLLPSHRYAIVFGHEIRGVDQRVVDMSDHCIEIPQYGTKHSLNIAVAAGIVIWEIFRQLH